MSTVCNTYEFDGTSALKHEDPPRFSVYDGVTGPVPAKAGHHVPAPARHELFSALSGQAESLRVTLLVMLIGLSLMLAGFIADSAHISEVERRISTLPTEEVRVYSGQTLWAIAEEHPVDGVTTTELVDWIEQSNGLSANSLVPGQTLFIPVVGK